MLARDVFKPVITLPAGCAGWAAAGGVHGRDLHGPGLCHRLFSHQDLQASCEQSRVYSSLPVTRKGTGLRLAAWSGAALQCRSVSTAVILLLWPGQKTTAEYLVPGGCRDVAHALERTFLISLLQPAPEVIQLFDDILLLTDGRVIYQ